MTFWMAKALLATSLWLNPGAYDDRTKLLERYTWYIGCVDASVALRDTDVIDQYESASFSMRYCLAQDWEENAMPGTLEHNRMHKIMPNSR